MSQYISVYSSSVSCLKKMLTDLEDLQRNYRQAITLNESTGPLLRMSNHQNSGGQKSQNTTSTLKKFYGNSVGKVQVDIIVNCGDGQNYLQTNGKVVLPRAKGAKTTNLKERKTRLSDLNDPIILSSDDDDSDRTNRRESISPQPAHSACSSLAPSTGKVEAGFDAQANTVFENIITEIGIKNNVSNFFVKIPFEEANSRLVAYTRTYEASIKGSCVQKENKIENVPLESKIQFKSKHEFQFFDDEETGESHYHLNGSCRKIDSISTTSSQGRHLYC
uniref:Uncharacterized protein n=1 Tax=Molossus molossus TaxID=27622 RepID=A0A7J8GL10_MOLMO|nr:hypothetical protein HJG59_011461 [Molossus molossus]